MSTYVSVEYVRGTSVLPLPGTSFRCDVSLNLLPLLPQAPEHPNAIWCGNCARQARTVSVDKVCVCRGSGPCCRSAADRHWSSRLSGFLDCIVALTRAVALV